MFNIHQPTYEDMHEDMGWATANLGHSDVTIDRIVGLSRGGLFPAVVMSHHMKVPMTAIEYSSKKGKGEYKEYDNEHVFSSLKSFQSTPDERILVVDDICDSGHTLKEVVQRLNTIKNHPVVSYAIYFKHREEQVFTPDFFSYKIPEDSPWIIFPWEKI
jgi:hypoxanthine phosphoribosyltransferase